MKTERIEVLDHGYVAHIDTWGSDERVIEAARMSTQKGFEGWGPFGGRCVHCGTENKDSNGGNCPKYIGTTVSHLMGGSRSGDEKLLRYLWEHAHHTPFEMAGMTIEVQAPIFVFREWMRHRVPFGYNEASARYTELPEKYYVPSNERMQGGAQGGKNKQSSGAWPEGIPLDKVTEFQGVIATQSALAFECYRNLLRQGVAREIARLVLPVNTYSKMRATSNLRGWLGFLKLRMDKAAQYEIRVYAEAVHKMLSEAFPRTLILFDEGIQA